MKSGLFTFDPQPGVVPPGSITNNELADMAALTVKGNATNATASPQDIAASSNGTFFGRRADVLGFLTVAGSEVSNTPAGNLAATTAQGAIDELDSEKAGLALANTFTAAQTINANTTFGFELIRTDNGSLGPGIRSKHESANPAVNDFVGFWNIYGETDSGAEVVSGAFQCLVIDPANATYKSSMKFVCSGVGGENSLYLTPTGIYTVSGGSSATGAASAAGSINAKGLYSNGQLIGDTTGILRCRQYTVATLPAAGTAGRYAAVTNALAPAYGAAVAGGGAINIPVYDNGAGWVTV